MVEKQFLCIKEAGQLLGVDSRTMKKILKGAEGLNYTRIGRKFLINKNKLLKYLDEHDIVKY